MATGPWNDAFILDQEHVNAFRVNSAAAIAATCCSATPDTEEVSHNDLHIVQSFKGVGGIPRRLDHRAGEPEGLFEAVAESSCGSTRRTRSR